MTPFQQREQNDIDGLQLVHRFGWLRSLELGKLMWPHNSSSRHQADRLIRSWLERGLVISRELPLGSGRAVVLAAGGVRLLADFGIQSSSGKDIGQIVDKKWQPPASWKHDLIATGVQAELTKAGYYTIPEYDIRRRAGNSLIKIPDGILINEEKEQVVWLEVEYARKTGKAMKELAEALVAVAHQESKTILGYKPTHALVAFAQESQDERGYKLNHQDRVRTAVAEAAKEDVQINWAICDISGAAGVKTVVLTHEKITANRAAKVRKVLDSVGWREEDGCLVSNHGNHRAVIWESENGTWSWMIDDEDANYVGSEREAKEACASEISRMTAKSN